MATLRDSKDIIKGSHLMILIDNDGTLVPIAFATSHTFSKQLNTQEISCKDFGDVAAVLPQNYSWTMQTDNLYSINGYKALNDAFKNMTKVIVYFGETNYRQTSAQDSIVDVDGAEDWTKEGFGEQGYAYITALDVTASAGENATFSATFTGTGTLTEIDTPVAYDLSLIIGSSSLIDKISLSASEATAGETITVTPYSAEQYDPNVLITTSPATTVTWSDVHTNWTFTMPAADVTVTAVEAPKYTVTKAGENTSYFNIQPSTSVLANSYVYFVPTDAEHVSPTYTMTAYNNTTGDSVAADWLTGSSYWQIQMPASNVTAYMSYVG